MTEQDKPEVPEEETFAGDAKDPKEMTDEEVMTLREKKVQERLEKLRKRDPFIYR